MDRFFLAPEEWGEERLTLGGDEAHHAIRVMRKQVGDEIEVFDGQGRWARGGITALTKSELILEVSESGISERIQPEITLAVCIPKGKTMDLIVQKSVELGVTTIQPLISKNTVVKISSERDAQEKSRKWQRIALEACKQCGQNWLPATKIPPTRYSDFSRPPWSRKAPPRP